MKVLLDTTPLENDHAVRGIGVYTKFLQQELEQLQNSDFQLELNLNNTIDIVHYPFFDLFSPTLPLPLLKKAKTVITIHDVIPLLFPEQYRVGVRGNIFLFKQKTMLKFAHAVITDSQASKDDIHSYLNVPTSKIFPIPLAGNPKIRFVGRDQQKAIRQKYNLPEKYILYVGDINFNKNIPQFIRCLKFLPEDFHIVCVGKKFFPQDIPEWKMIVRALTSRERQVSFVTSLGRDSTDDLSALYSSAAVYVQPSLAEGFGLPILESMQARTLVVCTRNSSLPEVGGKHVEYVNTNSESIAQGITNVLTLSSIQRQKRVADAWEWSKQFSWRKTAESTLQVYQSLFT